MHMVEEVLITEDTQKEGEEKAIKRLKESFLYGKMLLEKKGVTYFGYPEEPVVYVSKEPSPKRMGYVNASFTFGEDFTPKQRELWNNFLLALAEEPVGK